MAERKKVVVVGGGVAGSKIARAFDQDDTVDVALIDPKNYFEIPYPQPRSVVQPSFADRTLLLYDDFLKKTKVIQSCASEATATEVRTESGEKLPYDFLVIATGTAYSGPPTKSERLREFEAENKKVVASESVLVIGGGPVGVELAAEIVTDFPKKKVTIVSGGERLLEFLGPKASQKTEDWLKKRGVDVILRDHVMTDNIGPPSYLTKKHVAIQADTHFLAIGKKVGSGWLGASNYFKGSLTEDGRVKVGPTTQVSGFQNVFAAGDITDFKEIKQGYLSEKHATVVVNNIKKLIKNPAEKNLHVYKPSDKPIGVVTLGRVDSVAQFPFATVIGWLPGLIKAQDFFVGKSRSIRGLSAN